MSQAAAAAARLLTRDALCCVRLALASAPSAPRPTFVSHLCPPGLALLQSQHPAVRTFGESTLKGTEARLDEIQRNFAEAREEIDLAREDMGTTYFNESAEEARALVDAVLADFNDVLRSVGDDERGALQRSMGLKMEQLKAELKELDHLHDDD